MDGGNNCFGKRQDDLSGRFDMRRSEKVNPLYQRVLSALIVEDESDDPCHPGEGKNISLQYASDDSHCGSCNQIDIEPKDKDRMESEVESKLGFLSQKNCSLDRLSCDSGAITNSFRNPSMASSLTRSHEQWQVDDDFIHSDVGIFIEICSNDLGQCIFGNRTLLAFQPLIANISRWVSMTGFYWSCKVLAYILRYWYAFFMYLICLRSLVVVTLYS